MTEEAESLKGKCDHGIKLCRIIDVWEELNELRTEIYSLSKTIEFNYNAVEQLILDRMGELRK